MALRPIRLEDIQYLRKWLLIGIAIGVVAGLGSIAFFWCIQFATELFLGTGVGYTPPQPLGEGPAVVTEIGRRWMIPIVTTLGGLISGIIVYTLAPEAEGHGTDAAIDSFHNREGNIRARIPLIKMVASAVTIGSGGSAGREGPTAQIAAGFGSQLGRVLHLSTQDRRIAVVVGVGAGIGAIFKAPLGGALLSAEILYLDGFEAAALVPSFIASIVGYTVFASWAGYTPIFGENLDVSFTDPYSLGFYVLLGVACGVVGILYPRVFYLVRDLCHSLHVPNQVKPAIGGLGVGIMGMFLPEVLGMGYGWLQRSMDPITMLPVGIIVLLVFAKILATSLSIGTGGSGGVFAPGLFIGGMLGAAIWAGLNGVVPHVPATPVPFVVVGMMALFGGVARAPLAVMLMVGEMTGSYAMLAPAMVAVGISYMIVGRNTIYESQVESPAQSPAHRFEYVMPLLSRLKVSEAMRTDVSSVSPGTPLGQVELELSKDSIKAVAVVKPSSKELVGIVSWRDLLEHPKETADGKGSVDAVMTTEVVTITPDETLDTALSVMTQRDIASLPVVKESSNGTVLLGMLNRNDVARYYTEVSRRLLNGNAGQ